MALHNYPPTGGKSSHQCLIWSYGTRRSKSPARKQSARRENQRRVVIIVNAEFGRFVSTDNGDCLPKTIVFACQEPLLCEATRALLKKTSVAGNLLQGVENRLDEDRGLKSFLRAAYRSIKDDFESRFDRPRKCLRCIGAATWTRAGGTGRLL